MREGVRLDDMRVFWHVADAGSFTAAAERLGMPKQTVSRRVAALEEALGTQLLRRTTRATKLTEAGALYAAHCEELVRVAEGAGAALAGVAGDVPRGRLRVSADPHFAAHFLVDVLHAFAERHPDVAVELVATARVVDLLEEGFDVAVRIGTLPDSASLVASRLGPARILYAASPDYLDRAGRPTHPDDLATHRCIGPAESRWPFVAGDAVHRVPVTPRIAVNRQEIAQQLALAGAGITLFPEFAARPHLEDGALEQVLAEATPEHVGEVWVVRHRTRFVPAKVRAFTTLLRERFAGRAPWE